ncbi:MAG TPA: hypothetical protein VGK56_09865 [Anaerolineales bacterium]
MNIYPTSTDIRTYLSHRFSSLWMQALRDSLWARVTGRKTKLALFPEQAPQKSPNRKFLGVQDIPVDQIIGTISRQSDFDHKFRPLQKHLRDRWVKAYLTLERDGWSPALVHKVGEHFYVEDGHHRISVARTLGMAFVQATVWEYPCLMQGPKPCRVVPCPEPSRTDVYTGLPEQA